MVKNAQWVHCVGRFEVILGPLALSNQISSKQSHTSYLRPLEVCVPSPSPATPQGRLDPLPFSNIKQLNLTLKLMKQTEKLIAR